LGGGRFTTNPGLNFTQDVAQHYGDRLWPAFVGGFGVRLMPKDGLDYAQGGSRVKCQPGIDHAPTGTTNPQCPPGIDPALSGTANSDFAGATTIPVKEQVATYLSAHSRFTSRQLVLINGGADDVFVQLAFAQAVGTPAAQEAAVAEILQSASDLADIVATVVGNGATHVAVMNLPDIGKTPLAIIGPPPPGVGNLAYSQSLTNISNVFNATLSGALQQKHFGGKVILVDAFTYIDKIIDRYNYYGFAVSNTWLACNLAGQVTSAYLLGLINPPIFSQSLFAESLFCSPKTYTNGADYTFMFADYVHPTTHLNALFAQFVEQQIAAARWDFRDSKRNPL
jgi:phospholipase/lecithinase/hemolysin